MAMMWFLSMLGEVTKKPGLGGAGLSGTGGGFGFCRSRRWSARHSCWGWLLRDSRRDFLVKSRWPTQRVFDQLINEPRHGDSFGLRPKIQSSHEITPELRRIPFRSGHGEWRFGMGWGRCEALLDHGS